jgi:hypothetical protein
MLPFCKKRKILKTIKILLKLRFCVTRRIGIRIISLPSKLLKQMNPALDMQDIIEIPDNLK